MYLNAIAHRGDRDDEAQLELLVELVDLNDDPVDLVLQLVALALPLGVVLDDLVDRRQPAAVLVDPEAHLLERVAAPPTASVPGPAGSSMYMKVCRSRLPVTLRVDLAHAARRRVSRVDVARLARRLDLLFSFSKAAIGK